MTFLFAKSVNAASMHRCRFYAGVQAPFILTLMIGYSNKPALRRS